MIEIPLKLKRSSDPVYIPDGYVIPYDGELFVVVGNYLIKPNNYYSYVTIRRASFWLRMYALWRRITGLYKRNWNATIIPTDTTE